MDSNTAVFLQVRMASSRLPGKALLPLAGKPVIQHAMEALATLPAGRYALLTDRESAPHLNGIAEACGYEVFIGDPEDVLDRFCAAAAFYAVETIVRATGDNPLVSASIAREALQLAESSGADYAGITDTPYGTGVEVIRRHALERLHATTTVPYHREHVSPGLYENPSEYAIVTRQAPASLRLPSMRVTLDTEDDYRSLVAIYADLYDGTPIEIPELVAYGHRQHRHSA
jgi:spore coat polysaccharide biosynthesis protein SpsF